MAVIDLESEVCFLLINVSDGKVRWSRALRGGMAGRLVPKGAGEAKEKYLFVHLYLWERKEVSYYASCPACRWHNGICCWRYEDKVV